MLRTGKIIGDVIPWSLLADPDMREGPPFRVRIKQP